MVFFFLGVLNLNFISKFLYIYPLEVVVRSNLSSFSDIWTSIQKPLLNLLFCLFLITFSYLWLISRILCGNSFGYKKNTLHSSVSFPVFQMNITFEEIRTLSILVVLGTSNFQRFIWVWLVQERFLILIWEFLVRVRLLNFLSFSFVNSVYIIGNLIVT